MILKIKSESGYSLPRNDACNRRHPLRSATGHGRNASEFARHGSVGYTLEQKKAVIERILV
jgi:hypothetical protein